MNVGLMCLPEEPILKELKNRTTMRYTRILLTLLSLVLFAATASAQIAARNTFTNKTFSKASTSEDTSATITIGSIPFVSVATTSLGSDSSVLTVKIDGLVNGVWSNALTTQALTLGRPSGYSLAGSAKGQVANFFIRIPSSADLTQNCNQIRIRNVHGAGSGDSDAALKYTQNIILRPQ